jgi:hypothetical protein
LRSAAGIGGGLLGCCRAGFGIARGGLYPRNPLIQRIEPRIELVHVAARRAACEPEHEHGADTGRIASPDSPSHRISLLDEAAENLHAVVGFCKPC